MSNPDGYDYSRITDRQWRKNRRKNADGSFGVDLNRNWDENWAVVGASNKSADEVSLCVHYTFNNVQTYHGPKAFSEPETKLFADYILSLPNRYAGIDFHVLKSFSFLFS